MKKTKGRNKEIFRDYILDKYKDELSSISDILGDGHSDMSILFYIVNKRYLHWLDNNPDIAVCERELKKRRKLYEIIKRIGPYMLKCTQVFENRAEYIGD